MSKALSGRWHKWFCWRPKYINNRFIIWKWVYRKEFRDWKSYNYCLCGYPPEDHEECDKCTK